jgi:hypothetical protein
VSRGQSIARPLAPDDPRHGTKNGYGNLRCRCADCRRAHADYCRESQYRSRVRPAQRALASLPGETWKPIPGYEGLYDVSDLGRVRSLERVRPHWTGTGTISSPAQMLRLPIRPDGYRKVQLSRNGKARHHTVHSLVLEAFIGPRPANFDACHNNGDGSDNRLVNLRWDTKSANTLDTVKHGTHWTCKARAAKRAGASA